MSRWKAEMVPDAEQHLDSPEYELVSRHRFIGNTVAVIECDEAAAAELRNQPGVILVVPDDAS